jgi:hypothetical protein
MTPAELVTRESILATFGKPARTYHYRTDTILVWQHNLLPRLVAQPPAARNSAGSHTRMSTIVQRPSRSARHN